MSKDRFLYCESVGKNELMEKMGQGLKQIALIINFCLMKYLYISSLAKNEKYKIKAVFTISVFSSIFEGK